MTGQEKIRFDLHFSSVFENTPPGAKILIDQQEMFDGLLDNPVNKISFNCSLKFGIPHQLAIVRYNKPIDQPAQSLIIDKIVIDGINIQNIIWANSYTEPEYPEPWASKQRAAGIELESQVLGETWLGHKSTWVLKFTSPFYQFVMNNLQ